MCYLFLSYRWESDEHIAWVGAFAAGLRSRGYPVVLDRLFMEDATLPGSVEQLLNLFEHLNRATHFLPILTEGYYRRLMEGKPGPSESQEHWEDGWAYDEWTIATNASIAGQIQLNGIWRSGEKLPKPFTPANVCDFRGADLDHSLDRYFPPLRVLVNGMDSNGNARRVVGPVLYNTWPEIAARMQREDGFTDFALALLDD